MPTKKFVIRIAKEKRRVKPRSGVKQTRIQTPKTVYRRRQKHPKKTD